MYPRNPFAEMFEGCIEDCFHGAELLHGCALVCVVRQKDFEVSCHHRASPDRQSFLSGLKAESSVTGEDKLFCVSTQLNLWTWRSNGFEHPSRPQNALYVKCLYHLWRSNINAVLSLFAGVSLAHTLKLIDVKRGPPPPSSRTLSEQQCFLWKLKLGKHTAVLGFFLIVSMK